MKVASDLDDEAIPAWQRQSMKRSLQSARARAHARSDRFVAAATQLLQEKGNTDFTVQDVVDRSRMSIRTFYKYFRSKEDLLVALYETVVAQKAVPLLRKRIEKARDPRLRLRAYIEGLVDLTTKTGQPLAARTLVNYQNRLAESRPEDLAAAMKPQFDLLVELIADIARTRPLRRGLTVETAARLTHYTVLSAVHGRALGSEGAFDVTARTIWEFCLTGIGVPVGGSSSTTR
ncbi:MAG: TetR/AcrR family transcriptional regulator [Thermodesulfobacteriota bacterium]